jgi:putative endonuclease
VGELDLVVERRGTVVFVEVKTRSDADFGGAAARVDAAKVRRLSRVAAIYLSDHGLWERPTRFDVVTVERRRWWWTVHHIRDAFRADLGRMV